MVAKLDDQDLQELSGLGEHLIDSILADESTDVILKIIESNAPVWYQNSEGMSALHAAAYRQRPEVAKALLEQGAIWNAGMPILFPIDYFYCLTVLQLIIGTIQRVKSRFPLMTKKPTLQFVTVAYAQNYYFLCFHPSPASRIVLVWFCRNQIQQRQHLPTFFYLLDCGF